MTRIFSLIRSIVSNFAASLSLPPRHLCPVLDRHAIIDAMIERLPPGVAEVYADYEHENVQVSVKTPDGEEIVTEFIIRFPDQFALDNAIADLPNLLVHLSGVTGTLWAGWEDRNALVLKFTPVSRPNARTP
jgi:hypothetical protein